MTTTTREWGGEELVEDYLRGAEEPSDRLRKLLAGLDPAGRDALGFVLHRFDRDENGRLGRRQRRLATAVLERIHKPSAETLGALDRVLALLDVDRDSIADNDELDLVHGLFDLFAGVESPPPSLSWRELELVLAVLRHLDGDDDGVLDADERRRLREHLRDPDAFLRWQRRDNHRLRALWPGP